VNGISLTGETRIHTGERARILHDDGFEPQTLMIHEGLALNLHELGQGKEEPPSGRVET